MMMKQFKVQLKYNRMNREPLQSYLSVSASSLREAINKAKLQAFMSTSVSISKWSLNWAVC